jgi:SAM-dependent methyltransferase
MTKQMTMEFEVLDIGCGIDPEGDVNVDIENVFTEYGRRPRNFIVATSSRLPFKDKAFRLVKCHDLIEHLDDEEIIATLEEIKRVSDRAVIKVPNAYFIPGAWKYSWSSLRTDYRAMMRKFPHRQLFDEPMLKDALELVFPRVKIRGWGCWIAIPGLQSLLRLLAPVVPFLGQLLVAHCECE